MKNSRKCGSHAYLAPLLLGAILSTTACTKVTQDGSGESLDQAGSANSSITPVDNTPTSTTPSTNTPGTTVLAAVQCSISTPIPSYWINSASLAFTYSCTHSTGQTITSVKCELDGTATPCQSLTSDTVSNLADGDHKFRVIGTAADATTGYSHYALWGTDRTAPIITSAKLDQMTDNAPTFSFSATDGGASQLDRFQCHLSAVYTAWEDCTSPRVYPTLADSTSMTFEVRALDNAGNASAVKQVAFKTGPKPAAGSCVLATHPAPWVPVKSQVIQYACVSAKDPIAAVECRLNGGAWATCDTPTSQTLTQLPPGRQTFDVRMRTTTGDTTLPQTVSWGVDITAPSVAITGANTETLQPSFRFAGTDSDSGIQELRCQLNAKGTTSATWTICTSPKAYTSGVVAGHAYTFAVKPIDKAGNEGTPAQYDWIANPGVGPSCTILTQVQGGTSNLRGFPIQMTCSSVVPVAKTECRLDAGAWKACASPTTLTNLPAGPHTFEGRGTDSFGNVGAIAGPLSWTSDFTPPVVKIVQTQVAHPSARISFEGTDTGGTGIRGYECALNSAAWSPCASPANYNGLVLHEGYTFKVHAVDQAGNWSSAVSVAFKSEPTEPAPTCQLTQSGNHPVSIQASCIPAATLAETQCSLDGGTTWKTCPAVASYPEDHSGKFCAWYRGKDKYGRIGTADQICWNVDLDAPVVKITQVQSLPGALASGDKISVLFSATDVGQGVEQAECRLSGSDKSDTGWVNCQSPWIRGGSGIGRALGVQYQVDVRAHDKSQNMSDVATYQWKVQPAVAEYDFAMPLLTDACPFGVGDNWTKHDGRLAARMEKSVQIDASTAAAFSLFKLDYNRVSAVEVATGPVYVVYDDEFFLVANQSILMMSSSDYEGRFALGPNGFRTYDWAKIAGTKLTDGTRHPYCAYASTCESPRIEHAGAFSYVMGQAAGRQILQQAMMDRMLKLRLIATGDDNSSSDCMFKVHTRSDRNSPLVGSFKVTLRVRSQ